VTTNDTKPDTGPFLNHEEVLANYDRRLRRAKARVRSDLDPFTDWSRHGYARRALPLPLPGALEPERIPCGSISVEEFRERYECDAYGQSSPVVLQGTTKDWPARESWTLERLERDLGESGYLKVGESDNGNVVRLKVRHEDVNMRVSLLTFMES
jgi:hypothetical protein